ncbi:SCO family protein [Aquaticitalea lipolytica]|uniref:SCO family protein n=1 Tax=Aquaticitalea lipolytica TaxID=1247562 RepID=UPI0024BBD177|nr:SCO family protein [Aquaticitalea lipolytica]
MKIVLLFCFYFLVSCNSNDKNLPVLSYKIDGSGNKSYYTINYKEFTNQLDEDFKVSDKVFIANFFFTRCPSICPPMRLQLIDIAETFKNENDFIIISHTIDPENDTAPILKEYQEATGIKSSKWQFLRSTVENTKLQAELYMTNFKPNQDGTDFYHSSYVALVDREQQIRGFYNILAATDVERLKKDINVLLN